MTVSQHKVHENKWSMFLKCSPDDPDPRLQCVAGTVYLASASVQTWAVGLISSRNSHVVQDGLNVHGKAILFWEPLIAQFPCFAAR